ncbi:MAG: hypothetical protein GX270_02675 [Clostridiaceae bacterium]|jgi:hypothetical protein|nr:hypothetical protein [Clostridiaceae bacterium]
MINKYLQSRIEVDLEDGSIANSKMQLEYYLIESENNRDCGFFCDKVYGIEIVKKDSEHCAESEIIRNLSSSRENTKGILDILAKNTVTPVGVQFVLDDLMAL